MPSRIARRRGRGERGARREDGRHGAQSRGPCRDLAGPRGCRRDPRETPFQVSDVFERPLQSLPFGGAARQLLDGVPARLELDRIGGGTGESVLERPRPEGSSRPVEQRAEASFGGSVGRLEDLQRRDRRRVEAHSLPEAQGNGIGHVRDAAGPHFFRVGSRGRGGSRTERRDRRRRRGVAEAGARKPLRRTARQDPGRESQVRSLRKKDFPRPEERERIRQAVQRDGPRVKLPGRVVEEGDTGAVAVSGHDRGEIGGGAGQERLRVEDRARRDDARDVASDQALGRARVLDLVADRDLPARRDEPGDVMVGAVPRHAAHRRLDVGVAVARGQRDTEQGRRLLRVLEEHLVEIAHPVEEDRVGDPALHLEVLPEHRRGAGGDEVRGRRLAGLFWCLGHGG